MPSDPNARRDKVLESIAGELAKTNKLLDKIERNTRPDRIFIDGPGVRNPYYEKGVSSGDSGEGTGPYGSGVPFGT